MNRVDHHNSVLRRATRRALELEAPLAALLEPILARAGREAAAKFEANAVDYLAACALWEQDAARLAAAGPALSRSLVASLALRAAAPGVTSLSTMIAVKPRENEAARLEHVPGEPADTLHVTLAYLGEYDGDLTAISEALHQVAASHAPLEGQIAGIGAFREGDDGRPNILLPSVPGLVELRVEVTQALEQAGIDYSRDYGYVPHLTVRYTDDLNVFPSLGVMGEEIHFDDLLIVRGDDEVVPLPFTGVTPVTAAAFSVTDEIAAVAEKHQPDGGYGETWWRESDGSVFWAAADWSSNEEVDLAVADFEAVEGVNDVEACAECMPDGDGWERVYSLTAMTAAGPPAWSKPAGDEIVNVDQLVSTLRTKTDPVRQEVVATTMKTTLDGAGVAYDVTNPFTAKVLAQSGSQITNIAKSTQLNVMRIVDRSYNEGLSIPDTAKAIRAGMADAAGSRATLIARTELAGAVNGGSLAATQIVSEAAGIGYTKVWLTAEGASFPRHEEYDGLDGQATTLEGYFDVGGYSLQFPGDPDGPPEEVCNCRCTLVYEEAGGGVIAEGGEEADVLAPEELAAEGGGDGAAYDALSLADDASVASGPDVSDAAATMFKEGKVTKEDLYDPGDVAELDAHGESANIEADYNEMYGRLEKEVNNADWSNASGDARYEGYQAIDRVGIDQVTTLHDDAGRLLGIVDYNVPRSVSELEDAIARVREDLANPAWSEEHPYLRGIADQLEKKLALSKDPNTVIGVNHLASTGLEKGVGARLMQEVAKDAAAQGRGVGLNSLQEARGFYERLGMVEREPSNFYWTADQAKQFAETGTVSAPLPTGATLIDEREANRLLSKIDVDAAESAQGRIVWNPDRDARIPPELNYANAQIEKANALSSTGVPLRTVDKSNETHVIYDKNGEAGAAINITFAPNGAGYVEHLGSTIKGGGTELMKLAARRTLENGGDSLSFQAVDEQVSFYERLGFRVLNDETGEMAMSGAQLREFSELVKTYDGVDSALAREGRHLVGDATEPKQRFVGEVIRQYDGRGTLGVIRGENGKITGAVHYRKMSDGRLFVEGVGSTERGGGTVLMRSVADQAAREGVGVALQPTETSLGFYDRLGMTHDPAKNVYSWTPEQAREFAETGRVVVEPPPPLPVVEQITPPVTDRPYAHWQKSTLDRQIIKSRSIVKEALSKDPTLRALTDKERVLYDRHKAKLEMLLKEREVRAAEIPRPFAHLADATLARKQVAMRARLRELDAIAHPTASELELKTKINEQLRQITAERKYRKDNPDAVVTAQPKPVAAKPAPVAMTASQERMSRLKDVYASRPADRDFDHLAYKNPKEWEQKLSAAGDDFAKEVEDRLSHIDMRAHPNSDYALRMRRQAISDVMNEVRPMGAKPKQKAWRTAGGKSSVANTDAVVGAAEWAAQFYPREWVTTARTRAIKFTEDPNGRGFFQPGFAGSRHEISLSGEFERQGVSTDPRYGRVALHELGHLMEEMIPHIKRVESEFYRRRTEGGTLTSYRGVAEEPVRRDEFVNEYMGKDYGQASRAVLGIPLDDTKMPGVDKPFELLTMGMQSIFSGSDELWFADPDMRNFILGLLVGV